MNDDRSHRAETFDALYRDNGDPWNVTTSDYERRKFALTLAALPSERQFRSILDIGCSFGTLTHQLARAGDTVTAIDVSQEAIGKAREHGTGEVAFLCGEIPDDWPAGRYDLIVMSEILYFLSQDELIQTADKAMRDLSSRGLCLLVNWTGPNNLPVSGDEAARVFADRFAQASGAMVETTRHDLFRIDLISPPNAGEVA